MYRPEGWENPYHESYRGYSLVDGKRLPNVMGHSIFEAGADAMLEGLKKDAYAHIRNEYDPLYEFGIDETEHLPKGYLVFIPEEEK